MFVEGKRAFKDKKHIPERKAFAAIAANGGQQESGSFPPAVVLGGVRCVVGGVRFVVKGAEVSMGGGGPWVLGG